MCRVRVLALFLPLALALSGCYHQVVRTGASPGPTVIERPWTATFLFGLVPATTINTAEECPAGVAVVETEQTLPNGVVGALTLGIYTPQTVRITCAVEGSALDGALEVRIPAGATRSERAEAIREAVELARRTGERVVLHTGMRAPSLPTAPPSSHGKPTTEDPHA
jgi:hypothetical protein